jgi:hypothetical protein
MIDLKWRFPLSGHGTKKGINEAGIVGFSGDRITSLTREIIQNSLDAKCGESNNQPVRIEFRKFSLAKSDFPDVNNLKFALDQSYKEARKLNDIRPSVFFQNALSVIENERIPFLRISDFNTTGLKGVESRESSPWYNLVKSQGVSDKKSTDGGSFGIGKNAAFACSDLRTVIYATKTIDGEIGLQGVTNLISYDDEDGDDFTQGIGYLGVNDKNDPLLNHLVLDDGFSRSEPGTDIYIAGIYDLDTFNEEVIISVLDNFLYAIYKNTLELVVNSVPLNRNTLKENIVKYESQLKKTTVELYRLLFDENTKVYQEAILGESNDVEIRILLDEDSSRKISMIRNPWMKIKEMDGFARRFKFMGAAIIKGNNLNQLLRKTENPLHNDWEPDRVKHNKTDYKLITELITNIKNVIKDKLEKLHTIDLDSHLDIFGAEDYIPLNDDNSNKKIQRKVEDKIKSVQIRETNTSVDKYSKLNSSENDVDLYIEGDDEYVDINKPKTIKKNSKNKRDDFEENFIKGVRKVKVSKSDIKVVSVNRQQKKYRILINRDSESKILVKLNILDEQGYVIKNVLNIDEAKCNGNEVKIHKNYLKDIYMKKGINFIDITINLSNYVSIGVELYEV